MREHTVKPAASALPRRAHFHESPFTLVMRPLVIPGTTTNCADASASPLFLTLSVATAAPPGRGPDGAIKEGTRSAANSVIEIFIPNRATGAALTVVKVANAGHSGIPTFALFDKRTVKFNSGVTSFNAIDDTNFISQRIAGPVFCSGSATVVVGMESDGDSFSVA